MEDDDDMITMLEASTDEWPNGIAHDAMKKLQDKYEPTDFVTMVERTKAIEDIKMGKNESPEKMFLALNMINNRFKNRLPPLKDNELLSIVMAKVPSKYTTILAVESVRLGSAFSVKEARSALMTLYRAGSREDDDDNDAEVALNVNFKCYECGKRGHKASDCPQRKEDDKAKGSNNRKPRFTGKCFQCGKIGHRKEDCYQNPHNKKPKPSWWKTNKGKEAVLSQTSSKGDKDSVEILLMHMGMNAIAENTPEKSTAGQIMGELLLTSIDSDKTESQNYDQQPTVTQSWGAPRRSATI